MEAVSPGPAWRRYARLAAADPRVASYLAARRSPALARHLQLPFVRQFALTEGKQGYSGEHQTQSKVPLIQHTEIGKCIANVSTNQRSLLSA